MTPQENADFVMQVLGAIEHREFDRLADLYHPDIEFHWPPGLPYSGDFKGEAVAEMSRRFATAWMALQPTAETRRMDARLPLATMVTWLLIMYGEVSTQQVGALRPRPWRTIRCAMRLARAQMFYYDLPGLIAFLDHANA